MCFLHPSVEICEYAIILTPRSRFVQGMRRDSARRSYRSIATSRFVSSDRIVASLATAGLEKLASIPGCNESDALPAVDCHASAELALQPAMQHCPF